MSFVCERITALFNLECYCRNFGTPVSPFTKFRIWECTSL